MIQIRLASLAPFLLDKLKHNRGRRRRRRRRSPPMAMDDHDRDDTPHTGLSLTLSYDGRSDLSIGSRPHSSSGFELQRSSSTAKALEPSLTLALPGDVCASVEVEMGRDAGGWHSPPPQSRHHCKIKREDDVRSEEAEKVSSRISDEEEEEEDSGARKKLRLTKEQSSLLEDKFKEHSTLNPKQKQALAKQLNLRPRQVEVWFQNRRARAKLKKTEVELEFLRRCCETLTEEKRRLQKELQDLEKSHKLSAPRHMQIPATCPSCKKVIGGAETGSPLPASWPRFFNPFAHHAA